MTRSAARDISYATSVRSRPARVLVRTVENATGRLKLIKRAEGYERDVAEGQDFWEVMATRYGLSLDVTQGTLAHIPTTGPLIIVSNHPFGILDGLMMGLILSRRRRDSPSNRQPTCRPSPLWRRDRCPGRPMASL